MKTIYIDCSYLADHTELNTGIQRVVRRVVENFRELAQGEELRVQPVRIGDGRFESLGIAQLYPAPIAPGGAAAPRHARYLRLAHYGKRVYLTGRDFLSALCADHPAVRRFLYASRQHFGLSYLIDRLALRPLRRLLGYRSAAVGRETSLLDEVGRDDILLLLDSTWYYNIWPSVGAFRQRGGRVVAVIYDLIPITHAQFCDDGLVAHFKKWFFDSLEFIDGYIGISHTVEKDLYAFMREAFGERVESKAFDHFLLGADFKYQQLQDSAVRKDVIDMLGERPAYLIVSTVEPRKNHRYLLDAFDLLWSQGLEVSLVIVGRTGWKVEALMRRILDHPEYGRRLRYCHDLNDQELTYCYRHSRMLVFPSIVEGFGLPIVESLANGLPVLVSDTPIHREIGAERIGYFDLARPQDLAEQVAAIETQGMPESLMVPEGYRWLSWRESSQTLLERVLCMADDDNPHPSRGSLPELKMHCDSMRAFAATERNTNP